MLTINNIENIVGMSAYGNTVTGFSLDSGRTLNEEYYYVFHFKKPFQGNKIEVWLNREPDYFGQYNLCVMGWAADTEIDITAEDFRSASDLCSQMYRCLQKLEESYQ